MKHASSAALDRIEPTLAVLRTLPGLKEKARGCFYQHSRAVLHFHEHGEELYADVRLHEEFERVPATTKAQCRELVRRVRGHLAPHRP